MAKQAQKTGTDLTRVTGDEKKEFRAELDRLSESFAPMLPPHIAPERFARVVMSAIERVPRLKMVDRQSLWNACKQAAEDQLLPDGREGAIVPFKKGKDDDGASVGRAGDYVAQWIPMVGGVRKKVRESGLLSDWNVQVVYPEDKFEFELGDEPFIRHKPAGVARSKNIAWVYSIATFKDGTKSREVMSAAQVAQIAGKSKSRDSGPWSDPVFFQEMAKKTVAKLHAKQLPTNSIIDRLLSRGDELYQNAVTAELPKHERPTIAGGTKAALEHFAGAGSVADKQQSGRPATASQKPAEPGSGDGQEDADGETNSDDGAANAEETGNSQETSAPPKTPDEYAAHFEGWLAKVPDAAAARNRWKAEQDMRLALEPKVEGDRLKGWKTALDAKFG